MDAMKHVIGIAARCATVAVVALAMQGAARAAAGPPAWSVRYVFSAAIFGGTTADVDANGRFRIVVVSKATYSLPNHRLETSGTLPSDELEAMRAAVGAAHPDLWSPSYGGGTVCLDYYAEVALTKRGAHGDVATTKTSWGCRLTGLPADLRTLLDAVRGGVRARMPVAQTDTDDAFAALPVSWPLQIEDPNGAGLVRRVTIDADGRIASRERTSTTLFTLKACPQRDLGRVGPLVLARMHAMLGPLGALYYSTSADTQATFDAAMSDCPRPVEWLDANDYVIPNDAHWAVQFAMQRGPRSATVEVDSRGHADAFAYVFAGGPRRLDVPVSVDAATVAQLGTLVGAVKENGWPAKLLGLDTSCVNHLRIARFYGGQSSQALISVSCGNQGAPADVIALINLLTARFGAYAGPQNT
jgi:hypothetical protein